MDPKSPHAPEPRPSGTRFVAPSSITPRPMPAPEKKQTWAERLKGAAAGILTMIAVEHGSPQLPDLGQVAGIVQTMDTPQEQAAAQTPAQPAGQRDLTPYQSHTGVALPFASRNFSWLTQPASLIALPISADPMDRIVASIELAQTQPVPPTESSAVKEVVKQVYREVVDLLHDQENVAKIIAEAIVSKAVEVPVGKAIDELPEFTAAVLVALRLKKREDKEATPSLDQTAADLERINMLYAEGVPLRLDKVAKILDITPARVRAAMQTGLYIEEWHPVGVSKIAPPPGPARNACLSGC